MRLGFDAWGLSGDSLYTGMGRYAATLLGHLHEAAPEIDVHAYGGPGESRPEWLPDPVVWHSTSPSIHPKLSALETRLRELPSLASADRLDVFHSPFVHVRPSLPPVVRLRCPVVATVHDVLPLTHYGRDLPWRLRTFYRWNLRRAITSDRIVTVSEYSRGEILRSTHASAAKVVTVPNGVDFPPNPDPTALRSLGIRPPYLLFAGSYEPRKNLAGALECYREVVESGLPHQLVAIVERQSGHAAGVRDQMHRLGLEQRVQLLHSLSEEDLRAVYTHAEIVLFPSLAEGFGLPPVQAAACGVPVVASDLPVLREVMAGAAEFVAPHDPHAMAVAVTQLIKSEGRRREMSNAGLARAREFGIDACVRLHAALYVGMTESLPRPAVVGT